MNFVDVQPSSFLDYAWTTPVNRLSKPSKTSRKQNRCCDQCRRGKRACDAVILEDTLSDRPEQTSAGPADIHYSDAFGTLAPCGNCSKTKKVCTFEWLRSQRSAMAIPQRSDSQSASKRRKKASSKNSQDEEERGSDRQISDVSSSSLTSPRSYSPSEGFSCRNRPRDSGITTAKVIADDAAAASFETRSHALGKTSKVSGCSDDLTVKGDVILGDDLLDEKLASPGNGARLSTAKPIKSVETLTTKPDLTKDTRSATDRTVARSQRKRRRRASTSSTKFISGAVPLTTSLDQFFVSASKLNMSNLVLKIYHDSFENALSCWLTERICPHRNQAELSVASTARPNWNLIYQRVFKLDKTAAPIRGRALTCEEDKAASRAINTAIFAFATQGASHSGGGARYPFHEQRSEQQNEIFGTPNVATSAFQKSIIEFRVSAWRNAQDALHKASTIESFRVVLAQIVFSLTQRPSSIEGDQSLTAYHYDTSSSLDIMAGEAPHNEDVDDCADLLAKLDLIMASDGQPVHLEQGLRLIHSLRSRARISNCHAGLFTNRAKQSSFASKHLDETDEGTIDLLFWLGVIFDTLSSAMHKRPLVVSDEDSDIYTNEAKMEGSDVDEIIKAGDSLSDPSEGQWDEHLLVKQERTSQQIPLHWPCTYSQAAGLLCAASPVKVLLFRKVTRIQTLLSRKRESARIERAIQSAIDVYRHWQISYDPFIRDCIEHHDNLPPSIQSWYICLAGHFYLATLLLADLIETIDAKNFGTISAQQDRASTCFVAKWRHTNSVVLSKLARRACPVDDMYHRFNFGGSQGGILKEPWTAVLIRAFVKACVILLETDASLGTERHFKRANDCVRALWHLGHKSDMALATAKLLEDALVKKRKGIEENLEVNAFLSKEIWDGMEGVNEAFDITCPE